MQSVLKKAASVFSGMSLQAMGMVDVQNPFARLVKPKVDREPFRAPPREWINQLMHRGVEELQGEPRLAFVLALGAGLRWGEIVSLTWEEVQRDNVRISAGKAKGRRGRMVPIGTLAQRVLESERGQGAPIAGDGK